MKNVIKIVIFFLTIQLSYGQNTNEETINRINDYFNQIRNDEVKLRQVISTLPKGADIHHHYSGSVYAETYVDYVEKNNLWVNRNSYAVADYGYDKPPKGERKEWSRVNSLKEDGYWSDVKVKIIESWSKLYFNYLSNPTDEHFFSTFESFDVPKKGTYNEGLKEIKERAISENVSYIETMFKSTGFYTPFENDKTFNKKLVDLQNVKDVSIQNELQNLFDYYTKIDNSAYLSKSKKHNTFIKNLHEENKIDDEKFTMRYQNYFIRVLDPITIFKSFLLSFHSASTSELIVGVNIVAPENNATSMKDYWLHMQMFKFFKTKYSNVKTSMHAGELTLGLVKPEDLTHHINDAVFIANANRIGHGVDIAYERNSEELMLHMALNKIAVEINLSSNEFILGIDEKKHPILLYKSYGVPIVISTDDAGVLRTDLTEQFLILLRDYPSISYSDVKEMIYNSLNYSFIDEPNKKIIIENLNLRFKKFESNFAEKLMPTTYKNNRAIKG